VIFFPEQTFWVQKKMAIINPGSNKSEPDLIIIQIPNKIPDIKVNEKIPESDFIDPFIALKLNIIKRIEAAM
jgi:hypothetical protein